MATNIPLQILTKISPNLAHLVNCPLKNDVSKSGVQASANNKILTEAELLALKKKVYSHIGKFDRVRKLPYHNLIHTQNVYQRISALVKGTNITVADSQLLKIAALFHDYEHGVRKPLKKGELTFEEKSAVYADQVLKDMGFSLRQRLKLYGMIIGTTFSNPDIQPKTKLEKLLVIADLGGFNNSGRDWLIESLNVTMEIPKSKRPKNLADWLLEQQKFLNYVKKRLTPEAKKMNWQKVLEDKNKLIKKLLESETNHKPYKAIIKKLNQALA